LKRYKYVGKERDEESGLYYYGARYYAAWLARFVSVDPLQFKYPELTPFQYANNRPVSMVDLNGKESVEPQTKDKQKEKKEPPRIDIKEIQKAKLMEEKVGDIYSEISNTIGSNSEIVQYKPEERPLREKNIIKDTIRQFLFLLMEILESLHIHLTQINHLCYLI
jgi:RHS repeat-associated protein